MSIVSDVRHIQADALERAQTAARRCAAFAFTSKDPPAEMQLWNAGDNPTDYGVHRWTDRSIREVWGIYAARGNPLPVDIEHKIGNADPDELAPQTGGYAKLELRGGVPWVVFDWSAVAVEQITTGQRRFLSPDYDVDRQTGEIIRLARVALVADPGTHRARMLASRIAASSPTKGHPMDPMILAALRAALTAEDPKAAIEALLEEMSKAGDGTEPAAPVVAAGDETKEPAPGEKKEEAAAAPPAPPPEKKDEEVKPYAAAAPEEKKDEAVKAASAGAVDAVAAVVADLNAYKRDTLLQMQGHRLQEPVRIWAASQTFEIVKGLIDASPDSPAAPARVTATRGKGQGVPSGYARDGFQPGTPEHAEFQRITGTSPREPIGPRILEDGTLRITAGCPGEWRRQESERIAASGKVK